MTEAVNPVILSDFPDPDVIRVDDVFYMASTTMHFMPGCVILKSYDLSHWEIVTHVYDVLEDYDAARLENNKSIYGSGMWAPTLRFANGKFYVLFVANDTHKTYLFSAEKIDGPWTKKIVDGFYHDASLLFDDDGRIYIFYGNREIFVTELKEDLSGPKPGGVNKKILCDDCKGLGYEGSHTYKINGRYYLFNIHWPAGSMRTESCFTAEKIDGEWTGKDVVCNDMNFHKQGVAQGGIVQDAAGNWYGILFQDRGACGRVPVLCKVEWKDNFPVFGEDGIVPDSLCYEISDGDCNAVHAPFFGNDNFDGNKEFAADDGNNLTVDRQNIQFTKETDSRQKNENEICLTVDRETDLLTEIAGVTENVPQEDNASSLTVDRQNTSSVNKTAGCSKEEATISLTVDRQTAPSADKVNTDLKESGKSANETYSNSEQTKNTPSADKTKDTQKKEIRLTDRTNINPLNQWWEWNHIPDNKNWSVKNNTLLIRTAEVVPNMTRTRNTLTQRLCGCKNETIVTVNASKLNDGDYAGLCAFQSSYAFAGLKRAGGQLFVVSAEKQYGPAGRKENRVDLEPAAETQTIPWNKDTVTVKMVTDFTDMIDEVQFYYQKEDKSWVQIGNKHKLYFMLDFFTGCRAGLFVYSTEKAGGIASFKEFKNGIIKE